MNNWKEDAIKIIPMMQLYHHKIIHLYDCNMHMQYWNNFNKQNPILSI
jgi:hypothetical protein